MLPWMPYSISAMQERVEEPSQMDVLRRQKDRSYKNVFKGSVLVSTLMDHDDSKFATRAAAIKFAQRLLDAGHIESIVGSFVFEDSVHLYRWADETVVREAKKMVSITSHIPRKKLIELVDMQQVDGDDGYDMADVKDKLIAKFQAERQAPMTFATKEERRASRKERALRRRTLGAMQIGDAMEKLNDPNGNITTINKNWNTGDDDLVRANNNTNLRRSASMSQENLETGGLGTIGSDDQSGGSLVHSQPSPTSPTFELSGKDLPPPPPRLSGKDLPPPPPRRRASTSYVTDNQQIQDVPGSQVGSSVERNSSSVKSRREMNLLDSKPIPFPPPVHESGGRETASPEVIHPSRNNTTDDEQHKNNIGREKSLGTLGAPAPTDLRKGGDPPDGMEKPEVSVCRYDGVEMKALDIEHVDFNVIRPSASLAAINRRLDNLTEESYSYSDNEKQMLEQMKRMQQEHENVVKTYEDKITELLAKIAELRHMAEKLENKNGLSFGGLATQTLASETEEGGPVNLDDSAPLAGGGSTKPIPTPPIPPPPPLPSGMLGINKSIKPSKPAIKPRLKMRPLFWNRIILSRIDGGKGDKEPTLWHITREPKIDIDEFERLFGKLNDKESSRAKSLHEAMSSGKGWKMQKSGRTTQSQTAKVLEETRSRMVAIKLHSMHCQMSDIKAAVYNMDFSKIDLESIYSLYQIRGTKPELDKISMHLQCHEETPLDQPEQFLWELSKMSHFPERIECMMLQKRFNETLFNIDQQLTNVQSACGEIMENQYLRKIMEIILAFGNYMNGGTQRGQADGFEFPILSKIKDVKSMDNHTNLLNFIVRTYMRENEADAGKDEAVFRLPDPAMLQQAAQVSFTDLDIDLNSLQHSLQTHGKKAQLVCLDTEHGLLQPFKDKMDDFFETAEATVKDERDKLTETKAHFQYLLHYLAFKDTTEQLTPESVFFTWSQFCDDFKTYWKLEQKRIARQMFEKVEQRKRNRVRAAKRRKSVVEDGKSNMKQRFAQLRRRSENGNPTVKTLRSQSMAENLNIESDSDVGNGHRGAPFDGSSEAERPRRRRRPQSEIYETNSIEAVNYNSDASVPSRSETMAERMQRRRRSRVNSEEVQNNINNAKQEGAVMRQNSKLGDEDSGDTQRTRTRVRHPEPISDYTTENRMARRLRAHKSLEDGSAYQPSQENDTTENNRMARRLRAHKSLEEGSAYQPSHESDTGGQRTRRRTVSREDSTSLTDIPGDENMGRQRAYHNGQSDSMLSLTDVARYKPPGDRTPLMAASVPNCHQYQSIPYNKSRSRYGQQYVNSYEDEGNILQAQRHSSRSASPCGSAVSGSSEVSVAHDPGAPPRPALPVGYSNFRSRGQSDTDIMDTDQEKINYREAIRKLSSGAPQRRRSVTADGTGAANMAPKNLEKPRSRSRDPQVARLR